MDVLGSRKEDQLFELVVKPFLALPQPPIHAESLLRQPLDFREVWRRVSDVFVRFIQVPGVGSTPLRTCSSVNPSPSSHLIINLNHPSGQLASSSSSSSSSDSIKEVCIV